MKAVFFLMSLLIVSTVLAEGGKNRQQNPVLVGDCSYVTPGVIDLSGCELVPAPDQSGVQILICDSLVICTSEDKDEED